METKTTEHTPNCTGGRFVRQSICNILLQEISQVIDCGWLMEKKFFGERFCSQFSRDKFDDHTLYQKILRLSDGDGRYLRIIASKDDGLFATLLIDTDSLHGRLAIKQASADSPSHVKRTDIRAEMHEHNVSGFEGRFHAVQRQT